MHTLLPALAGESTSPALPLFRVIDLNRGEAAQTTLSDGKKVNVKPQKVDLKLKAEAPRKGKTI